MMTKQPSPPTKTDAVLAGIYVGSVLYPVVALGVILSLRMIGQQWGWLGAGVIFVISALVIPLPVLAARAWWPRGAR